VTEVAPLAKADSGLAVELLARAFRDNALNRAVVASPDPDRRTRSNRYGIVGVIPVARRVGVVLAAKSDGTLSGVLVSSPPNRFPLPPSPLWTRLRSLVGQGWRVARCWGDVFEALQLLHPVEPHWYLSTLGVEPSHQRSGVGTALLDAWLRVVDRSAHPAYLETDSESNVAFYRRAGFEVSNQTEIMGVAVWCMLRAAPIDAQQ